MRNVDGLLTLTVSVRVETGGDSGDFERDVVVGADWVVSQNCCLTGICRHYQSLHIHRYMSVCIYAQMTRALGA